MAVPFRRTSKTSKRMRRTHFKLAVEGISTCPKCGAMIKAHHVCPKCGYYDGKEVLVMKKEEKADTKKEPSKSQKKEKKSKKKTEE